MSANFFRRKLFFGPRWIGVSAALCFSALAADVLAHGVTFKFQDAQPADAAFVTDFLAPWANKISDDSGGRINLLVAPRDAQNAQTDLFQAVLDRAADIAWIDVHQPVASHARFGVFALALEGASSEGSSKALWWWADTNDLAFREFEEMRILAASRHDAPVFHLRDKVVSSLSDLKGMKIAVPGEEAASFLAAIDVEPVVTTQTAMGKALAESEVEGVLLSWNSLAAYGLEALVNTHAERPAGAAWPYAELSVLLMNADAYRGLADDLKLVIRANSGSEVSAWIGKTFDVAAGAARTRAAERGETINTLPQSDLAKWHEAGNAAIDQGIKDLDAKRLRGEKMVTRARKLIAEHDPAK